MSSEHTCKIEILTDRYDFDSMEVQYDSIDSRLLAQWRGDNNLEANGYRTLTEQFNQWLLRCVYDQNGRDTTANRVKNDYDALTGDDELLREEVIDDLHSDGIDAERVLADMISWSTMRTHLQDCLDGEKPTSEPTTDWERETVSVSRHVMANKVEEALRSLNSKGELPGANNADTNIQVLLSCPHCPTRIPFADALDRGFICKEHLS